MSISFSKFPFHTTMGIPIPKEHHPISYKKIEIQQKKYNQAIASTEFNSGLELVAMERAQNYKGYIVALKNFITGNTVFRRVTNDPQLVAIAKTETSTRFCPSIDPEWCIDIEPDFDIPLKFINLVASLD